MSSVGVDTNKRWRVWGVGIVVVLTALWAGWRWSKPVEPSYDGKPISFWLDLADLPIAQTAFPKTSAVSTNTLKEACDAVAAMGTNALPYIVARMNQRRWPKPELWYLAFYSKLPQNVRPFMPRPRHDSQTQFSERTLFSAVIDRAGTNAIPSLITLSKSTYPETRQLALLELTPLGLDNRLILSAFEDALKDNDKMVRFLAVDQLQLAAEIAPEIRPLLTTYLNEAGTNLNENERLNLLAAISSAGPKTNEPATQKKPSPRVIQENLWEPAFASLAQWQETPTPETKARVFAAFQIPFDTVTSDYPQTLGMPFNNVRLTAVQERELWVPLLRKGLVASNLCARVASAKVLSELGMAALPALPELITSLDDFTDADAVAFRSLQTLAELGPSAATATPTILRKMKDWPRIWEATHALERFGSEAKDAVPTLMDMAKKTNGLDQGTLLETVAVIDPQNTELIPMLVGILGNAAQTNLPTGDFEDLNDPIWDRQMVAKILGDLGPRAKEALPALRKTLREEDALGPRLEAMTAILKIAPEQGAEMVPVLIESLGWGESDSFRTPAIVAKLLGQIGPQASPQVIPELRKLLTNQEILARLAAAVALAKVAPNHQAECVATLHELLGGNHGLSFHFRVVKALWEIVPEDPVIMPELIMLLRPNNEGPVDERVRFVATMGAAARPAIPQLRSLLGFHEARTRRAAREALDKIEGDSGGNYGK